MRHDYPRRRQNDEARAEWLRLVNRTARINFAYTRPWRAHENRQFTDEEYRRRVKRIVAIRERRQPISTPSIETASGSELDRWAEMLGVYR